MKKDEKKQYAHMSIEPKWQAFWEKEGTYQPDIKSAKNSRISSVAKQVTGTLFYNLMMFPYPSAEGLHVGSVYAFGGADIFGRYKRMQGCDVFEPIGLDGFGIHSENHAIKTGSHPIEHAKRTEVNFYRQLHSFGNSFAWGNKLETYDPRYYKWTQWLFVQLFKSGLAYRKKSPVNYCPTCKTVLADEQVIDAKCERCNSIVEKRDLEQWYFRITNYAERLLNNIEALNWTEKVKIAQRTWIGKSKGVLLQFALEGEQSQSISVFTTALDTVFGVTFMVVSPEHPLVRKILEQTNDAKKSEDMQSYINSSQMKSEVDRVAEGKEKTGVFTGAYVINPLNNEKVPLWIADYVLMGYGTGAVMGVPGHDARDHEFAQKFGLQIKPVVRPKAGVEAQVEEDGFWDYKDIKTEFKDKSEMFNSGDFDGLSSQEAKKFLEEFIEKRGIGQRETTYHLRDWLISRQRYWGPPIPMIYCEKCAKEGNSWFTTQTSSPPSPKRRGSPEDWDSAGWYPVETDHLPVELPYVEDFKPMGTGKSPLANYPAFYEVKCPHCGADARRETDVSDTFLDSAWYFFRYPFVDRDEVPFDQETAKKWLPVHMYIGGAEHSVLHLLYARFITMVIHDLGMIDFEEPFSRFYAHGLIIKDGAKMSKSKGNVINPDDYIRKYGADTLRCYLAFLGPFNQGGDFRDTGIEGMNRFIKRVWHLFVDSGIKDGKTQSAEALRQMHKAIKKVTEDLEHLRYNTALAALMEWYNFLSKQQEISKEETEVYLKLLAPFAPHLTEELWQNHFSSLNPQASIHLSEWPKYDEKYLVVDTLTVAVQVNGKLRGTVAISAEQIQDKGMVEELARKDEAVAKFITGNVRQVIYVPGKIINFVVVT